MIIYPVILIWDVVLPMDFHIFFKMVIAPPDAVRQVGIHVDAASGGFIAPFQAMGTVGTVLRFEHFVFMGV